MSFAPASAKAVAAPGVFAALYSASAILRSFSASSSCLFNPASRSTTVFWLASSERI